MNNIIIIQARMGSSRLEKKIIRKVKNKMLIEYLLERMILTKLPVVLAIPQNTYKHIKHLQKNLNIDIFTGDELDVLKRYYDAATTFQADNIIRVTGDNPFTSVTCLLSVLDIHINNNNDLSHYLNIPWGTGVEVIKFEALENAYHNAKDYFEREHMTQYIHRNPDKFKIMDPVPNGIYNNKNISLTVDTEDDFKKFEKIVMNVEPSDRGIIELPDIINYLKN